MSLSELGVLTGYSFPTLKKKLENIVPTDGPQSSLLYSLKDAIQVIYSESHDSLPELRLQREREETRLASARAKKIELQNAVLEKALVPFEDAERLYADLVTSFKARLLAVPSKAAYTLSSMRDPVDIETFLKELINEALDELTRRSQDETTRACEATAETDG